MSGLNKPLPLAQIAATKDEDIDFGDIPELDETFWREAEPVEPDLTERIAMRVKRSVLDYLQGPRQGLPDADRPRARELCACAPGVGMRQRSGVHRHDRDMVRS